MSGGYTKRRSMADYSLAGHAEGQRDVDVRMERYHEHVGRVRADRAVWPGAAFVVEALLLLVFLTASLAVLMQLNADADLTRKESATLMDALVLASNSAEQFAGNPSIATQVQDGQEADPNLVSSEDLLLVREVEAEPSRDGTLYRAVITVWQKDQVAKVDTVSGQLVAYEVVRINDSVEPVYRLETARYVPGTTGSDTGTSLANVKGHNPDAADGAETAAGTDAAGAANTAGDAAGDTAGASVPAEPATAENGGDAGEVIPVG